MEPLTYADVASRGPRQSQEEASAPPMPQVEHATVDPHPLIDVDSDHVSTVPSDYSSQYIKTDTQDNRLEQEAESDRRRAEHWKQKAEERAQQKARQAKSKGKDLFGQAKANSNNPVVIGNVVVIGALAAVFGSRVYQRYQREGFSLEFFGLTAGMVALFGAADYFVSSRLFQKYPPKK